MNKIYSCFSKFKIIKGKNVLFLKVLSSRVLKLSTGEKTEDVEASTQKDLSKAWALIEVIDGL